MDSIIFTNQCSRVLKDKNGAIWSVTPEGVFVIEDGKTKGKKIEILGEPANYEPFSYLFEDPENAVWAAIGEKGVYRLKMDDHKFQKLPLGDTIDRAVVYKIIKDVANDDILWLGTSFGLCKLNRHTFERKWYIPTNDIPDAPSNKVSIFEQFGSEEIWMYFTYYNSLGLFDKNTGKFKQFRPPPEKQYMLEGAIKDIVISEDGNIWLATLYGLTNFDTKTKVFDILTQKDGLDENVLNTIILDNNGKIWLCGNRFLCMFDPEKRTFKNFQVTKEVKNFWSKSKYLAEDGSILLGSLNGIYTFNPDKVTENQELPNIVLTDFKVKDKSFLLDQPFENTTDILLSHDENDITFEFSAIHYINPQANKYRCKLEGFNDEWRDLDTEHKATYTNLNHGKYVFRVIASNSHGVWNEKGLAINLVIAPAFWQTSWFKGLIILVILSILYALFKNWQHQAALKRQKEIAEQSAEYKTRFLADVSHEIRTPMNAIIGLSKLVLGTNLDKKQHKFVKTIQQSSKNLLIIINDLLDHTKLEAGKFTFVKKTIRSF